MSHPGVGVMLGFLGGNSETVDSIKSSLGKKIKNVSLVDNQLKLSFEDETSLLIYDDGQSCCESRYMRTDDNLLEYAGQIFENVELKDAPNVPDEYGDHEVQFLDIVTDKGRFTLSNHNEHNGYYGGFWIVAKIIL